MQALQAYAFAGFLGLLGFYGYDSAMSDGPFIAGYIGAALPAVLGIGLYAVGRLDGKE